MNKYSKYRISWLLLFVLIIFCFLINYSVGQFENATIISVNQTSSINIECNLQNGFDSSFEITWLEAQESPDDAFIILENLPSLSFANNKTILSFTNAELTDQKYYFCGRLYENNSYDPFSSYYLYVKGKNMKIQAFFLAN